MKTRLEAMQDALRPFLPKGSEKLIANLIVESGVRFVVSRPRQSKLGDFRAGSEREPCRISVNGDLNPYAFLVTSIHEFAHWRCFVDHGRRVLPHGPEWKRIYSDMLNDCITRGFFPEDLKGALRHHLSSPTASSCSCPVLHKALRHHDEGDTTLLDELAIGSTFLFRRVAYVVEKKQRTRYLCRRLRDDQKFLISGRAVIDEPPCDLKGL